MSAAASRTGRVPGEREQEMFRLRTVDGLSLAELGERFHLHRERVRQLLHLYYGLKGEPPAVKARRKARAKAKGAKRRAEHLARAQTQTPDLLVAWRKGEQSRQIAARFGLRRSSVDEVIRANATSADRMARKQARLARGDNDDGL